jgi:Mg2+ and Co2+ transporter CorA
MSVSIEDAARALVDENLNHFLTGVVTLEDAATDLAFSMYGPDSPQMDVKAERIYELMEQRFLELTGREAAMRRHAISEADAYDKALFRFESSVQRKGMFGAFKDLQKRIRSVKDPVKLMGIANLIDDLTDHLDSADKLLDQRMDQVG